MTVAPIPPGYAGVTPHLIVRDAARAIDFYRQAFGATEALRLLYPAAGSRTPSSRSARAS